MTVANTSSRNQYIATSGQTVFPYTFEVIQAADIAVLKNGLTLSEGVDFTLTGVGNDNGGNFTLLVAASAGDIITIYRDMELSRANDYQDNGSFLASEVDADFDRLWLAMQQVYGAGNRALRASDDDTVLTESNTILPAPELRANKLIGFDATGAPSYNEIPALSGGFVVATNTENVVLTTAQTSVTFSGVTTSQTAYYVTGDNVDDARLLLGTDYTIASDTTITLLSTFPAGSIITAVQNEGAGEILSDIRTFDNVAAMKAANLTAGDTALCLRYYAGGDLVDGLLYEAKSSGTTDGYIDHDCANGIKVFLVKTDTLTYAQAGAKGDGTAVDSDAIKAMYLHTDVKYFIAQRGKTYIHDGTSIIVPENSVTDLRGATVKLQAGSYSANVYFFRNSASVNYDAGVPIQRGFKVIGGTIDGNEANVTMTAASTNAYWFYQCEDVTLDGVKIVNLDGDNGALAGITFRFSTGCNVINPDITNTDRQGIQYWESTGFVKGGSVGVSKFREPILISSENTPSLQGSNVVIDKVSLNNIGTTSGSHVVRFSGRSSGVVKNNDIQGTTSLNGVYVTFSENHEVQVINNDIRDCLVGFKVDTNGTKNIVSSKNRYHDCVDGFEAIAAGTDASVTLDEDKYYDCTDRPINIDFIPHVTVKNNFIRGGANNIFISNYTTLEFDGNDITGMTSASQSINLSTRTGSEIGSVTGNKLYSNTADVITTSEDVFARDNDLDNFIGAGIKLGRVGRAYVWADSTGNLRINTSLPANDTDGTVVGTQT